MILSYTGRPRWNLRWSPIPSVGLCCARQKQSCWQIICSHSNCPVFFIEIKDFTDCTGHAGGLRALIVPLCITVINKLRHKASQVFAFLLRPRPFSHSGQLWESTGWPSAGSTSNPETRPLGARWFPGSGGHSKCGLWFTSGSNFGISEPQG